MNCIFDSCELINGLVLGVISSIIVLLAEKYFTRKRLKDKYGKAEGNYLGYGFEKEDKNNPNSSLKTTLDDKPISEAEIKYLHDNILSIKLKHDNLIWEGNILMELETLGSIAWRYTNMPLANGKEQHWFGLKRCIVRNVESEDKVYVYLIGEKEDGYGKEILIRSK